MVFLPHKVVVGAQRQLADLRDMVVNRPKHIVINKVARVVLLVPITNFGHMP